jgi:hypothetical protein
LFAGFGKAHDPVKAVVIGEGQCGLSEFGRPGGELLDAGGPIEEGEV